MFCLCRFDHRQIKIHYYHEVHRQLLADMSAQIFSVGKLDHQIHCQSKVDGFYYLCNEMQLHCRVTLRSFWQINDGGVSA